MPKITGDKAHLARLKRLTSPEAKRQITQALFVGGDMIAVDAAISITNGSISGKGHVASRPGEAPNADTHLLDRSIETTIVGPLHVRVIEDAPYAAALEVGTSKMAARPHMGPAAQKNRQGVIDLVRNAAIKIEKGA